MNFRTTILLLILAAGVGTAYWFRHDIASSLGYAPRSPDATPDSLFILRRVKPDHITAIQIGDESNGLKLVRDGKSWSLPGGWPVRAVESQELVDLLTGLNSRFEAIAVGNGADLKPYGLDPSQKPIPVVMTVDFGGAEKSRTLRLLFGQSPNGGGNPFTRPTYFRLEGQQEVLQSAPGLFLVLKRPKDDYRKRQLFPDTERVRVGEPRPVFPGEPDAPQPATTLIDAIRIQVKSPDVNWTIERRSASNSGHRPGGELTAERLADDWRLVKPLTDRVDPERLKAVLSAAPELWVEGFVAETDPAKTGLNGSAKTVTVETSKRTVELQIGGVSRENEKSILPPNPPGLPPQSPPQIVKETYRYAKLPGNPQVFEVRGDKIDDLFVKLDALRDAKLFRFRPSDVRRIEIARPDAQIVFRNDRDESAKLDHWKIERPIQADADDAKVSELINHLSELRASGVDVVDNADPKAFGFDPNVAGSRLTIELSEEMPGDDKARRNRSVTLNIGKHDTDKSKLSVQVAGTKRINAVPDDFLKLFERPALVYRGRTIINASPAQVASIAVERGGEKYRLDQANGAWTLADNSPTESAKVSTLASTLLPLQVTEFVSDAPTSENLANYGLNAPTLRITVSFADAGQPPKTLLLGKQREGKPEVYAKLADGPTVFTIPSSIKSAVDQPSLAYRPGQLWQIPADTITAIEIQRGDEKYRLTRDGAAWKITGPFDAPASVQFANALAESLATLRVERFESASPSSLADYGLEKPASRVTIFAKEGEPKSVLIGKGTAGGVPSRFAKAADRPAVVVIGDALAKSVDRSALDLIERDLLRIDVDAITSVRGTGPSGEWALLREGGDWKITSFNPPAIADRIVVPATLRPWSNLMAEKFVAFGPNVDWAKYGLDRPTTTVIVSTKPANGAAESHTLTIGNQVEGSEGRFARLDDRPGVFVLPAPFARASVRAPLDFADHTLLLFDPGTLIGIRRSGPAGELALEKTANGWQIAKPAPFKADSQAMDELASQLAGLRATRIAALDAKDLTPFGLDRPAAVVTLILKVKDGKTSQRVLQVSDAQTAKSGERFVQETGTQSVAVIPPAIAAELVAAPIKFRDRTVARAGDADRIFVERGPRRQIFAKIGGVWKMTEPIASDAEATELEQLVKSTGRLRIDELVADKPTDLKPYGLEQPQARWRFLNGDREVLQLLVGRSDPASGRSYAKLSNSELVFVLTPDQSKQFLAEHRKRSLWSGLDAANIETLVSTVGDKSMVLQNTNGLWQVAGKPDQAVNTSVINDILSALAGLKVERYVVDKGADLKLYGLQQPQFTIVARSRSGVTATLYLGNREDGSKRVYARIFDPKRSDVFVLSEADSLRLIQDLSAIAR